MRSPVRSSSSSPSLPAPRPSTPPALASTRCGPPSSWSYEHPRTVAKLRAVWAPWALAVPAAMGAKVAAPDRTVWAIDGDGCFQMTNQELATCVINKIPIKVAIINNSSLGMVRQWQTLFYDGSLLDTHRTSTRRHASTWCACRTSSSLQRLTAAWVCVCDKRGGRSTRSAEALDINDRPVVIDFVVSRGRHGVADGGRWCLATMNIQYAREHPPNFDDEVTKKVNNAYPPHPVRPRRGQAWCAHHESPALFARRAFNIHSLAVGPREIEGLSRITVVVDATDPPLEQVTKQLNKLINVIKIVELETDTSVQREHMLIKVRADAADPVQVQAVLRLFRAHIVDVATDTVTIEATGATGKVEALHRVLSRTE